MCLNVQIAHGTWIECSVFSAHGDRVRVSCMVYGIFNSMNTILCRQYTRVVFVTVE